jgi:hypothetical protein
VRKSDARYKNASPLARLDGIPIREVDKNSARRVPFRESGEFQEEKREPAE